MRAARETCTWTIVRPGGKKVQNHWLRLMAEVNRLFKIQNIFKTLLHFVLKLFCHRLVCLTSLFLSVSPHSSCLSHLTLLVCLTSLVLSVSPHSSCLSHLTRLVCLTSLVLSVSPHSSCLSHLTRLVCLTSLVLSVSPHSSCLSHLTRLVCQLDSLSSRVINEIWSVMRDCSSFGVLHLAAAFSFICSVL